MKHILTLFSFLVLFITTHAQVPQGIPYQAAARSSIGAVLASTTISVRFSIRDSIATGAIKYRETHSVTTTEQGMFSLNVGQGTPVTGTFAGINWGANAKFMQVELDPVGGSSYIDMGTQQMMSVPYALNSGSIKHTVSTTGDTLYSGGSNYVIMPGISAANTTLPSVGTITSIVILCPGSTIALSNATAGGVWTSSSTIVATIGTTGIVTAVSAGTTTISYTLTNSFGSTTATIPVTVNPLTSAGTITGTATVCVGSTTTLSNATTGGVWSSSAIGVANVGSTGMVVGVAGGTALISYVVTNSCGSASTTRVVTVNALPTAGNITGTASLCASSTITLSNATTGGVWSSGATGIASVGSTGVVSGVAAGTATISYAVSNSCGSASTTRVVTVNPLPIAGTITGIASVTAGSTTTLTNSTTGGVWSSGATGVATVGSMGVVTGVAAGTATISYTVTNTCGSAVATRVVTVNVTIGSTFRGGVIAYILQPDDPGYVAGETHGLIATPSDQSTGKQWGCYSTSLSGTSVALGSGAANTALISSVCGLATAATLCDDLVLNGYSDWYLPSRNELIKLYTNRMSIGGFGTGFYWSSTGSFSNLSYYVSFYDGNSANINRVNSYFVRAVRTF